jgi:hypothetical protein
MGAGRAATILHGAHGFREPDELVRARCCTCALVLHSARFCAVFVLGCAQVHWAAGWRLVGIASAVGTLHRIPFRLASASQRTGGQKVNWKPGTFHAPFTVIAENQRESG